jgi:hypothetical protein
MLFVIRVMRELQWEGVAAGSAYGQPNFEGAGTE